MESIEPTWAWATYRPQQGAWSRRLAAHLYRRAGFAATSEALDAALTRSPAELVHSLVHESRDTAEYRVELDSLASSILATADVNNLPAWWVYRFLTTSDPLLEKMTLFWHGHFATSGEKVAESKLMFRQNQLLRSHALGNFHQMVHEISRDPAMLIYLDSATNRKAHPNENFARELMELFCLGEGQYTEQDIRELARCFTGWEIRNDRYRFNRYQHDAGEKRFLGGSGAFSGDEGIDIVLAERSMARFIVRKLIRFFVSDELVLDHDLVEPLALQFEKNGGEIAPVVEQILVSNLFFSEWAIARKIRSPIELTVGFLRSLHGSSDLYAFTREMSELGQTPFFPPNVKGWDGGRTWINSSTLLARANFIRNLLDRNATRFQRGDLNSMLENYQLTQAEDIVNWWEELMLATQLPPLVVDQLQDEIDHGTGSREQRLRNALHHFCTLPEFQLS